MNDQNGQAGTLNNLTLDLRLDDSESFLLLSSHTNFLAAGGTQRGRGKLRDIPSTFSSSSQSQEKREAGPSPRKKTQLSDARLKAWTIRLCQIVVDHNSPKRKDCETGSITEDEDHGLNASLDDKEVTHRYAWYKTSFDAASVERLCEESKVQNWTELEARIREAWDKGMIDILARSDEQFGDGTYSSIRVRVCHWSNTVPILTGTAITHSSR